VISNVIGALPQALEIFFEVKMKKINEKITPKKKKNQLFFFSLWTPLIFKPYNFFISYSF
jgi:hypothetical protein